jgi:hypothetical protein
MNKNPYSLPPQFTRIEGDDELAMYTGFIVPAEFRERDFDWAYLEYAKIVQEIVKSQGAQAKLAIGKMRSINFILLAIIDSKGHKEHWVARSIYSTSELDPTVTLDLRISEVGRDSGGTKKMYPRLVIESSVLGPVGAKKGDMVQALLYPARPDQDQDTSWMIIIRPNGLLK